jgi:aminoglycoside/choline kinase family phosphotransferase
MDNKAQEDTQSQLRLLYTQWRGTPPALITALPKAGSDRQYFRLLGPKGNAIGVKNLDHSENKAFLSFSEHFTSLGLPVPAIYAVDAAQEVYLQEDLGDISLLNLHLQTRKNDMIGAEALSMYQKSLEQLARMQVLGGQGLDYDCCVPRSDFDLQSIRWDLSYFKYYFLRALKIQHDEQALENDFETLAHWLLETDCSHFMFRDFQARNIMIRDGSPYFIDYQGGRRGALQYDVASLLYQAKADLPESLRETLLDHYISALQVLIPVDPIAFKLHYRGYVFIRLLQVLGSYGFRGFFERRPHFLDSIPFAIDNLRDFLRADPLPIQIPALWQALKDLSASETLQSLRPVKATAQTLTLKIRSFSYKVALPEDQSDNGGGFLFDCRAVHNPGRYAEYKSLTGRDESVKAFLEALPETHQFFANATALVEASVKRYLERGFSDLLVGFGCTGGQHRSVYFADRLAKELASRYPVKIDLVHIEQEKKHWKN